MALLHLGIFNDGNENFKFLTFFITLIIPIHFHGYFARKH